MTPAARRILDRMVKLAGQGTWQTVPSHSLVLRATMIVDTHPAQIGTGWGQWPEPTYERHLFVSLVAGKVIVGDASSPFTGRSDSGQPFWLAELVLGADDPFAVWDNRLELKRSRKAGIRGDGVRGYR